MIVIPNWFDVDLFKPDSRIREKTRDDLMISEDTIVVGLVGRWHKVKNHKTFIESIKILSKKHFNFKVLMCGDRVDNKNTVLVKLLKENDLVDSFILLGKLDRLQEFYPALDISINCSISEGFPNVVGESMSCGVPCIVTDVGESSLIVSDTGLVVGINNPEQLFSAMDKLIKLGFKGRKKLGELARRRIKNNYSTMDIINKYEKLYDNIGSI